MVTDPTGHRDMAYRIGNISYMPESMLPSIANVPTPLKARPEKPTQGEENDHCMTMQQADEAKEVPTNFATSAEGEKAPHGSASKEHVEFQPWPNAYTVPSHMDVRKPGGMSEQLGSNQPTHQEPHDSVAVQSQNGQGETAEQLAEPCPWIADGAAESEWSDSDQEYQDAESGPDSASESARPYDRAAEITNSGNSGERSQPVAGDSRHNTGMTCPMDEAGAPGETGGNPDDTLEGPDIVYDWTGSDDDCGAEEKAQMQALKAKIEDTVSKLSSSGKLWLRESLRKHLAVPRSEAEKERKKEMTKHIRSGHRTKLVLNKEPCEGCIAGTSRPKYATKNKGPYISKENTINSDTVFYPGGEDNNGDVCAWHGVELETRTGSFIPAANKSSMQTASSYLKSKAWMEALADPGGKNGFKIARHSADPGSEMKGAMNHAMARGKVQNHKGGVDVHTDQAFVERAHQQVQQMQASMFYEGIVNQPDDEALAHKVWGESGRRARQNLNNTSLTEEQAHAGISAIEQLTSKRGQSKEYFDSTPAFLAGGWVHIPKKNRKSKVSARAMKAVYGSRCEDQPGYHRVIPYHDSGVEIQVFPTMITN